MVNARFGYDSSNKQIQLIGMSRIVKGEDEYSGKGEDHVNLITGNYIGEWEYFDFEKETIVKIPKITSKMTFEKVYLQDYDYKQNRLFLTKSNIQYKKVLRKLNYQSDTLAILTDFLSDRTVYYSIFYWKSGDINNDKKKDFIVVLQSNNYRDDEYGAYDRKVLLIENIGYPELKLSAENNYIVDCSNCGGGGVGDPFQGITIKNNYFSFEQLYGAATKCLVVTTFKYNQSSKEWMLHKVGEECYGLN